MFGKREARDELTANNTREIRNIPRYVQYMMHRFWTTTFAEQYVCSRDEFISRL